MIAKIISDLWTIHEERRGIAGALAGEIGAYISLLDPPTTAKNFRAIGALNPVDRGPRLRAIPPLPTGQPVFDKIAGKLGVLPAQDALDVSTIYNVVTGMRLTMGNLSSEHFSDADDAFQRASLEFIAAAFEKHFPLAKALVKRLETTSNQSVWRRWWS